MARTKSFFSLHFLEICILTIFTILNTTLVHSKTLDLDIHVLRTIKHAINPVSISSSSFINTWDFHSDPCDDMGPHFLGILCTTPLDNSSSQITTIDLEGGGYDGLLSPGIGNLTELTSLNLSKNKFQGPIPNSITYLKKLTRLALSDNSLSGNIPAQIDTLKRLTSINLSRNNLSGSIPASFSSLRRLTHLNLSSNRLTGRIPDLTGLWQLRTLDLSGNHLYGTLPKLPYNLVTLLLNHNGLNGHISPLRRLQNLETLDLSNNKLSGSIISEVTALSTLNNLNLSRNNFSEIKLVNMTDTNIRLQVLDAHANHLRGSLPANLATYADLTTLDLGHNLFSGRIPRKYGEKVGKPWKKLFLDNNFLEGDLPPPFINRDLRIKGSLASNCLKCPHNVGLCSGGQRSASKCEKRSRSDSSGDEI